MTHDLSHPPPMSSTSPLASSGSLPIDAVERLFGRLSAICGSAMATVYAGVDPEAVKREWAGALAGFSAAEVRRGIDACRTRRFAPNLPEFLHLCRPSLDPEVAWLEAQRGMAARKAHQAFEWSHPAVYWAARAIDFDKQPDVAKTRRLWSATLEAEFARGAWASPPDFTQRAIAQPRQEALPVVPDRKEAVSAMLHEAAERARINAGLPPKEPPPEHQVLRYTDQELADMRRAQRLAEQGP